MTVTIKSKKDRKSIGVPEITQAIFNEGFWGKRNPDRSLARGFKNLEAMHIPAETITLYKSALKISGLVVLVEHFGDAESVNFNEFEAMTDWKESQTPEHLRKVPGKRCGNALYEPGPKTRAFYERFDASVKGKLCGSATESPAIDINAACHDRLDRTRSMEWPAAEITKPEAPVCGTALGDPVYVTEKLAQDRFDRSVNIDMDRQTSDPQFQSGLLVNFDLKYPSGFQAACVDEEDAYKIQCFLESMQFRHLMRKHFVEALEDLKIEEYQATHPQSFVIPAYQHDLKQ